MKLLPSIILFSSFVLAQVAHAEDIQAGSWTVNMALSMGGEAAIPAKETTICLQNVKELVNASAECAVNTTAQTSNHVDMKISCNVNGLKMDGTGSLSIAKTQVDGTLNLAMQMGQDQSVQTVSTIHAVRVGDCQK